MPAALSPIALSPADACRYLAISRRTLARLVSLRKIKVRHTGRRVLVDAESLRRYYEGLPEGPLPPVRVR